MHSIVMFQRYRCMIKKKKKHSFTLPLLSSFSWSFSFFLFQQLSLTLHILCCPQFKGCQILPKPIRVYVRSSRGPCGDRTGYRVARGLKRQSQSALFNNITKQQQQQAINQNTEQTLTCWIWGDRNSVWMKKQERQNHQKYTLPNVHKYIQYVMNVIRH